MDTSLPDRRSHTTSWGESPPLVREEHAAYGADVFWTLFGIAVLVTFLFLVIASG